VAVAGIDFVVGEREIFGLLGPNGAGKTTTISALTTRVRPTSGRVLIDGLDIATDPVKVKLRLAVVPQVSNLDRALTAVENLTFHAAYFGAGRRERRRRADEMLERFGLADRADEQVRSFSGGMAQRLMVARALMHQPMVLILDEPTVGLDPQSRLFLWEAMLDLRERGTTLVLTTHDMSEADRLCDRIAIIDKGRILALDTPRGLRGLLPAERGIELVLETGRDVSAVFAGLPGVERIEGKQGGEGRCSLRLYGTGDRLAGEALNAAQRAGLQLAELRRIEGSLEDVFIHLTGREMR
jgi:ABC-2 type transport system ATP-binding protein